MTKPIDINTHGARIEFGKHRGELFTRLPVSYIKWMINENTRQSDIARAEFERRGDTMPKVELSGHAINNASLRVLGVWKDTRQENEGLYSWLERMTLEAIESGATINGKLVHNGLKLAVEEGEEYPVLKTIMRDK